MSNDFPIIPLAFFFVDKNLFKIILHSFFCCFSDDENWKDDFNHFDLIFGIKINKFTYNCGGWKSVYIIPIIRVYYTRRIRFRLVFRKWFFTIGNVVFNYFFRDFKWLKGLIIFFIYLHVFKKINIAKEVIASVRF